MNLIHMTRFDWERMVRRLDLPPEVKLLAFTIATYGDLEGESIRPGDQRLANVLRCSTRTIRRNRQRLLDAGLLQKVEAVRGRGKVDVYELTMPDDVLDQPGLLDPDERPQLATVTNLTTTTGDKTHDEKQIV